MVSVAELRDKAGLPAEALTGDGEGDVRAIAYDSREVTPGALFCCVPGARADGHQFAPAAVAAGAVALLVERHLPLDVPQLLVSDARRSMGLLAAALHDWPARRLTMVGVTGTNGKTTTTHLIRGVLERAGWSTGMIGTLTGRFTTPESPDLQRQLAEFIETGATAVVMEVSSHALALDRVVGAHFDRAVFTNFGRDHLDLHGTEERYFASKARLFEPDLSDRGIVNVDDPHGRLLCDMAPIPIEAFSEGDADAVEVSAGSLSFRWHEQTITLPFGGAFNVANALAAAVTCASLGIGATVIAAGLSTATPVPGRFEPVITDSPFSVVVDYAHKPDALAAALRAARRAARTARVIVVVGAGGDRDPGKRPLMGAVAAELADIVVFTSDNPRSEDPMAIIAALVAGVPPEVRGGLIVEPDRRAAIAIALSQAGTGDVVVLAGKGNEDTQTIGADVAPFDDRQVARELLGDGS